MSAPDMFPDAPPSPVSLDEQIRCVAREIDMRQRVYPRWVAEHRMVQKKADHEIAAMRAVLATLQSIKETTPCDSNSN